MFDPQGPWAKQSFGVFSLPEDGPDALLVLLRIAHLQFLDPPDALVTYQHLVQLAVLCDKYDTVHLVRPWISKWQAPLQAQAEESRQEGGEGYEGFETWLFIAWTFGDEAVFRKISRSLVLTSTVTTINGEKRLVNPQGVMIGYPMPPGCADAIIEARSKRISALLEMCYELVDQYVSVTSGSQNTICTQDQSFKECDILVYGCLINGPQSLKLFPHRAKVSDIDDLSVMAFSNKLRSLKCFAYPDVYDNYYSSRHGSKSSHSNCAFTNNFANQIIGFIHEKEPSGVLEAHLTHMDQRKK